MLPNPRPVATTLHFCPGITADVNATPSVSFLVHVAADSKVTTVVGTEVSTVGWGAWVAQLLKRLPLVQVMVPESWDESRIGLPTPWGVCISF